MPRAPTEEPLDLGLAIGDVDVEVDRQLDRRRLRHPVEAQRDVLVARIGRLPRLAAATRLVAENRRPEAGEPLRVVARERRMRQLQHAPIVVTAERDAAAAPQRPRPFRGTHARASPPGWGERPPATRCERIDEMRACLCRLRADFRRAAPRVAGNSALKRRRAARAALRVNLAGRSLAAIAVAVAPASSAAAAPAIAVARGTVVLALPRGCVLRPLDQL